MCFFFRRPWFADEVLRPPRAGGRRGDGGGERGEDPGRHLPGGLQCREQREVVGHRGGGDDGLRGASQGAGAPGHGERSRSQLLFKLAGTETRLIWGWLFKFGC